jgi:hypothetical protein
MIQVKEPCDSREVYVGDFWKNENLVKIKSPEDTLIRLQEILRNTPGISKRADMAVYRMSGRWRDLLKILWREFTIAERDYNYSK